MRYDANKAEVGFFSALAGQGSITKEAAEADSEVRDFLGIKAVSPQVLKRLESQASEDDEEEPQVDIGSPELEDVQPVAAKAVEPPLPSRETHGKLFTQVRSHPVQILDVLKMRYKDRWLDWEPDTLWWALRRDFGSVGEISRNKIQALLLAETTDVPWIDWDTFENSGQAWNDFLPIFGSFQPLTPMQVAFTVSILREVRPDEEFGNEINAYIAAVLDEHGWAYAPEEWFAGAQVLLDRKDWLVGLRSEVELAWQSVKEVSPEDIQWEESDARSIHLLKMATVKSYLDGRAELKKHIPGTQTTSATASPPVP